MDKLARFESDLAKLTEEDIINHYNIILESE